jgi:putative FmdB family regulatory protein
MPIYEYRCEICRARWSVWARTHRDPPPLCTACNATQVTRLLSRFAAPKSEEARLEALADPSSLGDVDEDDPQSVARWMNRVSRESGEDLGAGFEEEMERAAEDISGEDDPGAQALPGATDPGANDE